MSLQDTLKFIHFRKVLNQKIVVLLCLFSMTACANLNTPPPPEPIIDPTTQKELIQLQNKVKHLEELLEEKEAFILEQNLIQQKQIKAQQDAQQDTSNEVTRAQLKLHRLATKPSTASTIAEVEVAM
ncbi:MAG: hypothetical protein K0U40_01530, partial [Betaproteobacteria bacterium]|nr:hypothetical protein [Betaproteobacteria bacterium]